MKRDYLFGDMFVHKGYIFRIYNNLHPKGGVIAYPIYKIKDNKLTKDFESENILKKYLRKIGRNNYIPVIPRKSVEIYFSCFDINKKDNEVYRYYLSIKRRLKGIGVSKVGLTGSNYLRLNGYELSNKNSDIDLIVKGKNNCLKLKNKLKDIYDSQFTSYEDHSMKIYNRRKHKSSPFFIDYFTAKNFESKKPLGILNGKIHVNITPTLISKKYLTLENIQYNNLGLKEIQIVILDTKNSIHVPGFYSVHTKDKKFPITSLHSNFFFYLLGGERGDCFKVRGNVIEVVKKGKTDYVLELDSKGNFKDYFMNLIDSDKS